MDKHLVKLSLHAQCNETSNSSNDDETSRLLTFTVVLMLLLGLLLLCSNILRVVRQTLNLRLGDYNLNSLVRMVLKGTFIVFVPLLSSVFERTKDHGGQSDQGSRTELHLMLLWLLLVELIRKKMNTMDRPPDSSSFTRGIGRFRLMGYAEELGNLTWIGYLIYGNIRGDRAAIKALFISLWSYGLAKLLQREINIRKANRSWHNARNPLLIAGYMQHVMEKEQEHHSSSAASAAAAASASASAPATRPTMETCKFVVAKEHKLVTTKDKGTLCRIGEPLVVGVHLNLAKTNELITIDKIWKLKKDGDSLFQGPRGTYLENLCLSFSLFKLLRRLFEQYPMVEVGSSMGRRMMIEGLLYLDDDDSTGSHHRPFQVLQLELEFLRNYYQAPDSMVMSSPILFFINFALFMLLGPIYFTGVLVTLIINNDAKALYKAAKSWSTKCLNFKPHYLAITLALLATVIFIEAAEFFTSYLLANWNTVRLVCSYSNGRRRLLRNISSYFVKFRFFIYHVPRSLAKLVFRYGEDNFKVNQVSIVDSCWPIRLTYKCTCQATLRTKTKEDIIKSLKLISIETGHISLQLPPFFFAAVTVLGDKPTGRKKSITEIILLCHLATELYEIDHQKKEKNKLSKEGTQNMTAEEENEARAVATTLSRYCMYLVEHMPALLPDDETWISDRASEMKSYLTRMAKQCCSGCMVCTPISHCYKEEKNLEDHSTLENLLDEIKSWDELACFWVNLLIYLAPSNNIQGHAKTVASSSGELISYLWAFCTHAGITRLAFDASDYSV